MLRHTLTAEAADRFAAVTLGHVTREYPNKPDHVLAGPEDARTPSALHPIFHGSYDWHSCVHGYWLLARVLRRFPEVRPGGGDPRPVRSAADAREGRRGMRLPRRAGRAGLRAALRLGAGC